MGHRMFMCSSFALVLLQVNICVSAGYDVKFYVPILESSPLNCTV